MIIPTTPSIEGKSIKEGSSRISGGMASSHPSFNVIGLSQERRAGAGHLPSPADSYRASVTG